MLSVARKSILLNWITDKVPSKVQWNSIKVEYVWLTGKVHSKDDDICHIWDRIFPASWFWVLSLTTIYLLYGYFYVSWLNLVNITYQIIDINKHLNPNVCLFVYLFVLLVKSLINIGFKKQGLQLIFLWINRYSPYRLLSWKINKMLKKTHIC